MLEAIAAQQSTGTSQSLNHIYCCDPDAALCGADVSTHPEVDLSEADCVVCVDLEDAICPTCGE